MLWFEINSDKKFYEFIHSFYILINQVYSELPLSIYPFKFKLKFLRKSERVLSLFFFPDDLVNESFDEVDLELSVNFSFISFSV